MAPQMSVETRQNPESTVTGTTRTGKYEFSEYRYRAQLHTAYCIQLSPESARTRTSQSARPLATATDHNHRPQRTERGRGAQSPEAGCWLWLPAARLGSALSAEPETRARARARATRSQSRFTVAVMCSSSSQREGPRAQSAEPAGPRAPPGAAAPRQIPRCREPRTENQELQRRTEKFCEKGAAQRCVCVLERLFLYLDAKAGL